MLALPASTMLLLIVRVLPLKYSVVPALKVMFPVPNVPVP